MLIVLLFNLAVLPFVGLVLFSSWWGDCSTTDHRCRFPTARGNIAASTERWGGEVLLLRWLFLAPSFALKRLQETEIKLDFFNGPILAHKALLFIDSFCVRACVSRWNIVTHPQLGFMFLIVLFEQYVEFNFSLLDQLLQLHMSVVECESVVSGCAFRGFLLSFELLLVRYLAFFELAISLHLWTLSGHQIRRLEEGKWLAMIIRKLLPIVRFFGESFDFFLLQELNAILVVLDFLVVALDQLLGSLHGKHSRLALKRGPPRCMVCHCLWDAVVFENSEDPLAFIVFFLLLFFLFPLLLVFRLAIIVVHLDDFDFEGFLLLLPLIFTTFDGALARRGSDHFLLMTAWGDISRLGRREEWETLVAEAPSWDCSALLWAAVDVGQIEHAALALFDGSVAVGLGLVHISGSQGWCGSRLVCGLSWLLIELYGALSHLSHTVAQLLEFLLHVLWLFEVLKLCFESYSKGICLGWSWHTTCLLFFTWKLSKWFLFIVRYFKRTEYKRFTFHKSYR